MALPKILVTGATGKTGACVVDQLLAKRYPVRASVRMRDARSRELERRGAEVVVADLFDPDQLRDAMSGVQRAYYLPPIHPYAIHSAVAFSISARDTGLESIVQLGQWLSHRSHPALMTRQTWLMDQLFGQLDGIAHTIVNPGMFADNFLRVIDFAALLGLFSILMGDSTCAPVSNEDIARTVVAALERPDLHAGRTYRPTGPELLSGNQMAAIVATVVGHRVLPMKLPLRMFLKVAQQQRVDPFQISSLRYYIEDNKNGGFSFEGGVTTDLEALTGAPGETFETTARRYAAMPFAKQTVGNRLKAFANFNLTLFYPGYDLRRIDRAFGFPTPPNPTFSIEDGRWRREHSLPLVLFVISVVRSRTAGQLALAVPLWMLVGLQSDRVGVELFLHRLWIEGLVPRMLTFDGANVDIWIGASAPVAAFVSTLGRPGLIAVRGWNVLGLLALANVVVRSALTAPGPLHLLDAETVNRAVGTFPYTFVAAFLAPLAIVLHVLALRSISRRLKQDIAVAAAPSIEHPSRGVHR